MRRIILEAYGDHTAMVSIRAISSRVSSTRADAQIIRHALRVGRAGYGEHAHLLGKTGR